MERRIIFTLSLLLLALHTKAGPITMEQARQKAATFLQGQQAAGARRRAPAAHQLRLAAQGQDATYYIYNAPADGEGFVVVSGDDATEPVLGYSNTGTIDPDNMPCGMRALLYGYEGQIRLIRDKGLTYAQTRKANLPKRAFMVSGATARFDQHKPYWNECPEDGIWPFSKNTLTGCVATAMAQLMYYHQKPEQITRAIPGYTTHTEKFDIEEIPANTAINWQEIRSNYYGSYNDTEAEAVAYLMKLAGTSVHMDYTQTFSGTYSSCAPWALKLYFGYDLAAEYRAMASYPSEWEDMLRDELENRGPVIYSGNDAKEGHTFLLEGYDENGYFYVNYGWNTHPSEPENGNGWFLLQVSDGQKEEDLLKYHINQDAIFNVKPREVITDIDVPLRLNHASSVKMTNNSFVQRNEETGQFENVGLSVDFCNEVPFTVTYDVGVAFCKDGNYDAMQVVYSQQAVEFVFETLKTIPVQTFPSEPISFSLDDGMYSAFGVSRESGKDTWQVSDRAKLAENWFFVCNGRMTARQIGSDNTDLRVTNFEQTSTQQLRVGQESQFSFTVADYGVTPKPYSGCVVVLVSYTDGEGNEKSDVLAIDEANCANNERVSISFPFTPTVAGEQTISVLDKHYRTIYSCPVTAIAADHSLDLLEVVSMTIDNQNTDGSIDGTYVKGSFTLHNEDVVSKYEQLAVMLEDVETGTIVKTRPMQVNIAPDDTVTYGFQFNNLIVGKTYRILAKYRSGETMFKSVPMLCNDEGTDETEVGNDNLVLYEYWFDNDIASRVIRQLNSSRASVRANINTDNLDDGMHRLNFRVKRSDGKYSSVSTTPFLKLTKEREGHLDYWIDNSINQKKTLPLADTEDEQLLALDLSDQEFCPQGNHRVNIQIAPKGSVMGTAFSQHMQKLAEGVAEQIEYWFDDDVAHSRRLNGKADETENVYNYADAISMGGLSPGMHLLNIRAASATGITNGNVLTTRVLKLASGKASEIEYWFDDDVTHSHRLKGKADNQDYIFDHNLNLSGLPIGLHQLNLRATATNGSNLSPLISCRVLKLAASEVSMLQYWFDGDFAHSRTMSGSGTVTDNEGCLFVDNLDLTGLAPGHHRLHYRAIGSDGQATTATGTAAILVKTRYNADEEATMASYSIVVDNKTVAYGSLSPEYEVNFSYVIDTYGLNVGTHQLKATFWNSFGMGVTEQVPFLLTEKTGKIGDVNADGKVTTVDAWTLMGMIRAGAQAEDTPRGDVNNDGRIDVADIIKLATIIAGGGQ